MNTKPIVWGSLAFAVLSAIIFLGGIASVQNVCNDSQVIAFFGRSCSKAFRYTWWTWAYLLFAVFVVGAATATGLHKHKAVVVGITAPLLVLMMDATDRYLAMNNRGSSMNCLITGLIMSSIAAFLIILAAGFHSDNDEDDGRSRVKAVPPPTGATTYHAGETVEKEAPPPAGTTVEETVV